MFTNNTRDEVTLIFLKHKYQNNRLIIENAPGLFSEIMSYDTKLMAQLENAAILATFQEVRERNAENVQAGSYEAIGKLCDEFLESICERSWPIT